RVAASRLVPIPAETGLLPEAAELTQPVGDARIDNVRLLDIAALADVPADVVAGEVAHAKRPHRHAEFLKRAVNLGRRRAFLQQEKRLAEILLDHAVPDEAIAYARDDGGLAHPLGDSHGGDQHIACGPGATHDLEQLHDVGWTEKMHA